MRSRVIVPLLVLGFASTPGPAPAQLGSLGSSFYAASEEVFVRFVFSEAMFFNTLNLYTRPDPDAMVQTLFSNRDPVGTIAQLDPRYVNVGEEIFLGLLNEEGVTFFSGAASRNPDGEVHFLVGPNEDFPPGGPLFTLRAGIEDMRIDDPRQDGFTDPQYYHDVRLGDYNDIVFDISGAAPTVIPEPATMLLLGSGIAGLAAVRRRRREG